MRSVLAVTIFAAAIQAPTLTTLVPQIERAALTSDTAALERYRERLRAIIGGRTGEDLGAERYTLAYADWRLSYLYDAKHVRHRQTRLDEARRLLEDLTAESKNAEALALLAAVYGGLIDLNRWKSMTLGPKASETLAAAAKSAPDNPRVALLHGMNSVYTPKLFGGGLDVAERHLRRAETLFARTSETEWPNWGAADASAWLGRVLQQKGDLEGARAMYERALAIAPEYAWVKAVLLPSLNRPRRH